MYRKGFSEKFYCIQYSLPLCIVYWGQDALLHCIFNIIYIAEYFMWCWPNISFMTSTWCQDYYIIVICIKSRIEWYIRVLLHKACFLSMSHNVTVTSDKIVMPQSYCNCNAKYLKLQVQIEVLSVEVNLNLIFGNWTVDKNPKT